MARRRKQNALFVWMNGQAVGKWTIKSNGTHSFHYDEAWLDSSYARPVSLSLPLQPPAIAHTGPVVEAFFDNLLPNNADIRNRIRNRYGAASSQPFDLLAEIGRDCVGAIQLLAEGERPGNIEQISGHPLAEAEIAAELRGVTSGVPADTDTEDDFRISIAGAQEKTGFLYHNGRWNKPRGATPTTHIFKLPLGPVGWRQVDLSNSIENEWLCARILAAYNIPVANSEIQSFEDQRVLVVERFDRRLAENKAWIIRNPQEDFLQIFGIAPDRKYESEGGPGIETIMDALRASQNSEHDRRTFFKAQIVFWLLAAIDGHAKNFSIFIEPQGRFRMTPLYDVISAYPVTGRGPRRIPKQKLKMAMAVSGRNRHYNWNEIVRRHWIATAKNCGFEYYIEDLFAEIIDQTPDVVAQTESLASDQIPAGVAEPILTGLSQAIKRL